MEQLRGLDAAFVAVETATMHMHMGVVLLLEPPAREERGREGFCRFRAMVAERLHLAPPLRRRVVEVPFGIHHPVWIEDPEFDLDAHLHRCALPDPGSPEELSSLVGEIMGRPLSRRRPLWEMHYVEGLESGYVAVVVKIHHAALDGVAGVALLAAFMDLSEDQPAPEPPLREWCPDPVPTPSEMLLHGLASLGREPEKALSLARRSIEVLRDIGSPGDPLSLDWSMRRPPLPFEAPRAPFNGQISPERNTAFVEVSLAEIREVAKAFDCRVNDVVLAAVGGALRRLMVRRDELLADDLVALVPVSMRSEVVPGDLGNQVSAMLVGLGTSIQDPLVRLQRVREGSTAAKEQCEELPGDLLEAWAGLAVPAVGGRLSRLAGSLAMVDRAPPPFNVVVSNLPGPPVSLFSAGRRLAGVYPLGPVVEGVGLNVTVMSYAGAMYFGLLGCPALLPDIGFLAVHLRESLTELVKLAGRAQHGPLIS